MNYTIYRLEFNNGVRFGHGNLDSSDFTFHADTLFSALYQEALKVGKEKIFLNLIEQDKLVFSDSFPYMKKQYFIPKPLLKIQKKDALEKGNSREKKLLKNMKYIPIEFLEEYKNGNLPVTQMDILKDLGRSGMKVSVGIRGNDDPEPYRVSAFYFGDDNGLYIILGFQEKESKAIFEMLLESLSYTGIGGKKSSGLGRFECKESTIPIELESGLQKTGRIQLLLSTALPVYDELEDVLNSANYSILKRSGFIDSDNYAEQHMRKAERYVFAPGSCFYRRFKGTVKEERNRGAHPIFRYEKALFLGVDI